MRYVLRHYRLVIVTLVAVVISVAPALANTAEPSFAQWWNDTKDWDDIYGRYCFQEWLNFDDQHSHYRRGIWGNGDGFSELEIELTSNLDNQVFGWYTRTGYDDGTTPGTLYQIFSGGADAGATWNTLGDSNWVSTSPAYWGFYYQVAGKTYYSDPDLNNSTNWDYGVRAEVFSHPRYYDGYAWAIGWEDGDIPNNNGTQDHCFFEDPAGDGNDNPDPDYGNMTDLGTKAWGMDGLTTANEPDFQDLVVTFRRCEEGTTYTPEVPEPGTWILLLASGAVGSFIRRRRSGG